MSKIVIESKKNGQNTQKKFQEVIPLKSQISEWPCWIKMIINFYSELWLRQNLCHWKANSKCYNFVVYDFFQFHHFRGQIFLAVGVVCSSSAVASGRTWLPLRQQLPSAARPQRGPDAMNSNAIYKYWNTKISVQFPFFSS